MCEICSSVFLVKFEHVNADWDVYAKDFQDGDSNEPEYEYAEVRNAFSHAFFACRRN